MSGVVLVGVSSSQNPEFVVGSLARICKGVLPEMKYQGLLLNILNCFKFKFKHVEVRNVPFSVDQELRSRPGRSRRAFGTHSPVERSLS